MNGRVLTIAGRIWLGAILVFLYAPILIMALMSFNASPFYQLPFEFSTRWYQALGANAEIREAALAETRRKVAGDCGVCGWQARQGAHGCYCSTA